MEHVDVLLAEKASDPPQAVRVELSGRTGRPVCQPGNRCPGRFVLFSETLVFTEVGDDRRDVLARLAYLSEELMFEPTEREVMDEVTDA